MACALCEFQGDPTYRFTNVLRDLGVKGDQAHPACVILYMNRLRRKAKKNGQTLEQLVADQQQ